ncbi:MAG: hypothetical protein HWE24_11325 [Oceanospirillaceae bacterium]|nr:hypothetical protein [Oceanospirillaceae bacterium]
MFYNESGGVFNIFNEITTNPNVMDKRIKLRYEDLRKERSSLDNWELGDKYTEVFNKFNDSMDEGNYLLSFLLIQNLVEDRMYVLLKYVIENLKSSHLYGSDFSLQHYHSTFPSLKRVVEELHEERILTEDEVRMYKRSVVVRNRYIHFSFMNQDVYTKELCEEFLYLFREVDKKVQLFKKNFM